jgi:hypothetical protein
LLEQAERKIELLTGVDAEGNPVVVPFVDEAATLEEKAAQRTRRRSRPHPPEVETRTPSPEADDPDLLF